MKSLKVKIVISLFFAVQIFAADKPNVILIMADDVGIDAFSDYIGMEYSTPNIDRMGEQGIRFTHCYSQPLCTPSRVKIMTGQYNFRNYTHFGYLNPADKTFGNLMRDAGYKTAVAGKWQLNGAHNKLPGYDDPMRPFKAGFDEFLLWQLVAKGSRYWNPVLNLNGTDMPPEELNEKYGPDVTSDFVCDFIKRNVDESFFVYYPIALPHSPFVQTPDSASPKKKVSKKNKEAYAKQEKGYFIDMVAYLDKIVGKIIQTVDDEGIAEKTLILFTSDNGTYSVISSKVRTSNQVRMVQGGKGATPELGTHVPLYALWRGTIKPGTVSDALIDFTDFYVSLAELAGVDISNESRVDGVSFVDVLKGGFGTREYVQCTYTPYHGKDTVNRRYARDRDYKLYSDGYFYHIPTDLLEEKPLAEKNAAHRSLENLIDQFPELNRMPAAHNRTATERDIYPDWQMKK